MKNSKKNSPKAAIAPVPTARPTPAPSPVVVAPAKPASTTPVVAAAAKSVTPVRNSTADKTIIEAKIDVGFGNQLYVRGQGAGLSWERGTPLACVDSKTWRLQVPATDKLTFKLLLNDAVWSQGEDITAVPGTRVEVNPTF
jgi:hypothetical protein